MWLTDKEQEDLLAWQSTTTQKIKEYVALLREQDIIGKIMAAVVNSDKARENAEKAWKMAQRLERIELRAKNAALAAYKMEVKEE